MKKKPVALQKLHLNKKNILSLENQKGAAGGGPSQLGPTACLCPQPTQNAKTCPSWVDACPTWGCPPQTLACPTVNGPNCSIAIC